MTPTPSHGPDSSQPGASGYAIPQNTTWMDPRNRRLRVITIGAGFSGILMAYQMQKGGENMEHVVYEKNRDIGGELALPIPMVGRYRVTHVVGTWLENRYPNAGCDIPSHAYTYRFALVRGRPTDLQGLGLTAPKYPDWPRYFSYAADIWEYLDKVCAAFDLRRYMQFHADVVECRWGEAEGTWRVRLRRQLPGQRPEEFDDYCHVLINACGVLNNFKVSQSLVAPRRMERFTHPPATVASHAGTA
jgi:cation diffusion facilitator CzcD-associated flavoprotein CzcO